MENLTMKELTGELDTRLGHNGVIIESLEAIKLELGHIVEDVTNIDKADLTSLALTMRDIDHKIIMLDSLMHYLMNDLQENHVVMHNVKDTLHHIAHNEQKEPTA